MKQLHDFSNQFDDIEHNHSLPIIDGIPNFVYEGMQTPRTIPEAKEQIIDFLAAINDIRDQLDYETGHKEWKNKAIAALRIYESKSKILKRWVAIAEQHATEINQKRLLNGYYKLADRVDRLEQQLAALQGR
ncbi:MAG: hypothetical protein ACKO2Z_16660 [Sphaerospermopsis kisseleviana]